MKHSLQYLTPQDTAGSEFDASPAVMNLTQVIRTGSRLRTSRGEVFMPAFGTAYSDQEIAAVANYSVRRFGRKVGQVAPNMVRKARAG